MPRTTVEFEVTGWEPADAVEHPDGLVLGRAVVRKVFRGDLDATSVADLLTVGRGDDGRATTGFAETDWRSGDDRIGSPYRRRAAR